jgi:hypothetical protein
MSRSDIIAGPLKEFAHHGLVKRRFMTGVAMTKRFATIHREIIITVHAVVNACMSEGHFYLDQFQRDMERQFPGKFLICELEPHEEDKRLSRRRFRLVCLRPPDWHYLDVGWWENAIRNTLDPDRASGCKDLNTLYDKIHNGLLNAWHEAHDPPRQELEVLRTMREKSPEHHLHEVYRTISGHDLLGTVPD